MGLWICRPDCSYMTNVQRIDAYTHTSTEERIDFLEHITQLGFPDH